MVQLEQSLLTHCLTKISRSFVGLFLITTANTVYVSFSLLLQMPFNLFVQGLQMFPSVIGSVLQMKQVSGAAAWVLLARFVVFDMCVYTVDC